MKFSLLLFHQRYGTVRGEDVPFCFGLPISSLFPYNYTQHDIQTSRILIHYLANFIQTGYVSTFKNDHQFHASLESRNPFFVHFSRLFNLFSPSFFTLLSINRNPNGDATPTNRHSLAMDSLKHLSGSSHFVELLPKPSSLLSSTSSSSSVLMTPSDFEEREELLHFHLQKSSYENSSVISRNDDDVDDDEDVIESSSNNNGRASSVEAFHSQQQTQFIHHPLSSANNRHRRSLMNDSSHRSVKHSSGGSGGKVRNRLKHHLMKRYVVKRNFPNNQLSKTASVEMDDEVDSNEMELGALDEADNEDDYDEREKKQQKNVGEEKEALKSGQHDRLEDDEDNESDLEKSTKMYVPYWDAYDTVNQLFLEMSEYYSHAISFSFSSASRSLN